MELLSLGTLFVKKRKNFMIKIINSKKFMMRSYINKILINLVLILSRFQIFLKDKNKVIKNNACKLKI